MSDRDFCDALQTAIDTKALLYYPRPDQYEEVLIILHDKSVRYVTCKNCNYPVLFLHSIGEVDDACKNELGKVSLANVNSVHKVYGTVRQTC